MIDLVLESARTITLLSIVLFLLKTGASKGELIGNGWNFIVGGFALLLFGSMLDITDNFESLNRYVVIGDTDVEAFLEKFVGYMGGFISLALGLVQWMPGVQRLTEEISQREEAEIAAAQAVEANSATSNFLVVMSHEIRTPMNGVLGMADLISRTNITAEQREYVEVLKESGNSLMTLLNDILDLSKIEAVRVEIEKRDFSVGDLLDSLTKLWSHSAHDKGLSFSIQNALADNDVVRADGNRLRQVLNNLVGNAIKFTAEGRVELRVKEVPRTDEMLELRFEVHDTGIGIREEQREAIFLPFTQADGSTTRHYGGTGLGLTICKNLVALQGGRDRCRRSA